MTDEQSNQLDMYLVVNTFYTVNQATIDVVVALQAGFGNLNTNINLINKSAANQSTNPTGVTQNKTNLRTNLDTLTYAILQPATAWAIAANDPALEAEFKYAPSDIERIKDDIICNFCQFRLNLISDNLAAMADFGITAPLLASWETAINDYNKVLSAPREAVIVRSSSTNTLKNLFTQTQALFRNTLDPLMVPFKTSDPDLYFEYQKARIVIDRGNQGPTPPPPVGTATVSGIVSDEITTLPIAGATVSLGGTIPIVFTEADGKYQFVEVPAGEYMLKAEAAGYIPKEKPIIIEPGAELTENITLLPSGPTP